MFIFTQPPKKKKKRNGLGCEMWVSVGCFSVSQANSIPSAADFTPLIGGISAEFVYEARRYQLTLVCAPLFVPFCSLCIWKTICTAVW